MITPAPPRQSYTANILLAPLDPAGTALCDQITAATSGIEVLPEDGTITTDIDIIVFTTGDGDHIDTDRVTHLAAIAHGTGTATAAIVQTPHDTHPTAGTHTATLREQVDMLILLHDTDLATALIDVLRGPSIELDPNQPCQP